MAAILDVWISKPGDPCYVDDQPWFVTVFDSDGNVYRWAGQDYGDQAAAHAHWAGSIPPGCYVVQARGKDSAGNEIFTDHAIAEVGCEGVVCIRLYVSGPQETGGGKCKITITDVKGHGSPNPRSIEIKGTATNCSAVEVSVVCRDSPPANVIVSVSATGEWAANVSTHGLHCKCSDEIVVHARCTTDPQCGTTFKAKLTCNDGVTSHSK